MEPALLQSRTGLPAVRSEVIEFVIPDASGPVLVEILSAGANLDTRLVAADGQLLSHVRFDYLRSVPLYHVLDATTGGDRPRLRIVPLQTPAGATVSVRFYSLARPGRAMIEQAKAWRDLARGQQRVDTLDENAWHTNLQALDSAQVRFARLDLEQPARWAAFLHAYQLYFPLYRYAEAAAEVGEILAAADPETDPKTDPVSDPETPAPELSTLRVLAHQLAGQIQLESGAKGSEAPGTPPLEVAREHFTAARQLATRSGLSFEETWAINNLGIADFYEDKLEHALEHYAQALRQAEAAQDSYLIALVSANVAVAQERSGRIEEAVHTLERVQQEATMRDSPMEREHLLSLLGAYYVKLYRFPDALAALNEALQLSNALESSENRARNRVKLGRAYREMGQPDKALAIVEPAVAELEAIEDARGLRQAHRLLADLHHVRGDFEALEQARQRQWAAQPPDTDLDRADWLFSRAEDARARGDAPAATVSFRDSSEAYAAAGFTIRADIARLHACAAEAQAPAPEECSVDHLQRIVDQLEKLEASAQALGARFAWVNLLAAQGRRERALGEAERLVDDIRYYRQELPGVLGAWYWDAREAVLSFYLQLLLDSPGADKDGRPDVLLALDHLRNSGPRDDGAAPARSPAAQTAGGGGDPTSSLRSLLAQRDRAQTPGEQMEAQRLIDGELAGRRLPSPAGEHMDSAGLLQQLAQLPPGWTLLAYHLAEARSLAWVGDRSGLDLIELGPAEPIVERIERVKAGLRVYNEPSLEADLAELSQLLLRPVQRKLGFNVLLAAGGALSDLPVEVLPLDGRPFIEEHQVVHIQSVRSAARSARRAAEPLAPGRLFLAGDPDLARDSLNTIPGTRQELQALRAAFPTIEANVYTGAALTAEAFRDGAFASADLVHLASHALIDRDYPELSRLMVSGGSASEPAFLTPADLAGTPLAARLVVLSACETVGVTRFDFDNRLGFVSQLLQQSDALVIASLWPVADRITGQFMADFYRELAATGSVPDALRAAKLRQRAAGRADDRSWAAFQLFSR